MTNRILLVFILLLCTACSTSQAIHNVSSSPIPIREGASLSLDEVSTAIKNACIYKKWEPEQIRDGLIEAKITVRGHHTAVVDISYDTKSYNITYKESVGLDHKGNKIHRNYNKWVILLDEEISANLASSKP